SGTASSRHSRFLGAPFFFAGMLIIIRVRRLPTILDVEPGAVNTSGPSSRRCQTPGVSCSAMARARFLHVSDIHLGAFSEDPIRRAAVGVAFERALAIALDEKLAFVVIAGALFDKKTVTPDVLRLPARPPLERLREAGIPVFAIEGNHDEPVHGARHSWVS